MSEFELDKFVPVSDYEFPEDCKMENFSSLYNWAECLFQHPAFEDLMDRLWGIPRDSTIGGFERAVLYTIMRSIGVKNSLEIGTYMAGTTQLMAVAALQDDGTVHTIDPQGSERGPKLLAQWPAELSKHVVFKDLHSTDFLNPLASTPTFDLIFIDGDHTYPNVIHDLYASDANLRPGGVIIGDNAELSGVLDAFRHFIRDNPDYDAVRASSWTPMPAGSGRKGQRREVSIGLTPNDAVHSFIIMTKSKMASIFDRTLNYWVLNIQDLKLPAIAISGCCSQVAELELVFYLKTASKDGQANGVYENRQFKVFTVEPGEFHLEYNCEHDFPVESEARIKRAVLSLSSNRNDGTISDLKVFWGDVNLGLGGNILPQK